MKPSRIIAAFAVVLSLVFAVYATVQLHEPAVMAYSTNELAKAGIDYTGCYVTNGQAIVTGYINRTVTDEEYAAMTNRNCIASANIIGYDRTGVGSNGAIVCYNDMQRTNVEYTFTTELPATSLRLKRKRAPEQKPKVVVLGQPQIKAQSTDTSKKKRPEGCGCFMMKRYGNAIFVR